MSFPQRRLQLLLLVGPFCICSYVLFMFKISKWVERILGHLSCHFPHFYHSVCMRSSLQGFYI
ncbi:hypothetical protein Syun_022969 [Stephania yunnanensis]|uniref:Uncharacterized protein n=1 Tax=Stephania yunnanensis TaxID=152371 RepID=A0AAP0FL01_9MAGN